MEREPARRDKKFSKEFRRVKITFLGGHYIREVVAIFCFVSRSFLPDIYTSLLDF